MKSRAKCSNRPDAGYRIAGFVGTDPELLGKSLINPRVIGLTSELDEVVRRENIDRIIVAMGERRGQLPTNELLQLSLAGTVNIEEGASFYERVTGRVSLNMIRPSWLIFSSRGRQARISGIARNDCAPAGGLGWRRCCRCRSRSSPPF